MSLYGYARVSSISQNLEEQIDQLINYGVIEENIYAEKITGRTINRPILGSLLGKVEPGDTIVISKLDRLARNTKEAIEVIDSLINRNIKIEILNIGTLENNTMGKLFRTVLIAFSEFERDIIVERTQAGKAYSKKTNPNYKEGRPKRILDERYLHALKLLTYNSYTETAKLTGLSKSTLQRIKKQYLSEVNENKRIDSLNILS